MEITEESEEEIIEEPPPLPDVIEVPWKLAARLKNLDVAQDKVHNDLKEFFYKNKVTESVVRKYQRKTSACLEPTHVMRMRDALI